MSLCATASDIPFDCDKVRSPSPSINCGINTSGEGLTDNSCRHTVEELQQFSNTRTPSPPWTHVVRLLVPMSCCDDAATYLIKALGGEEVTKRVVGGTKWWQVRGVRGCVATL